MLGIARMASESPQVRERSEVAYFALPARSLLSRVQKGSMPFAWGLNPYRGCEFGCKYCYARYTHEFMEMWDGRDFERKIYAKTSAPDLLRVELRHARDKGLPIALGTATDPYQPAEKQFEITRRLLEVFAEFEGLEFSITTKSVLVLRDLDLLRVIAARHRFGVHMTVTTLNARLARLLEPKAPPPVKRLDAVERLVSAGIYAGVNAMPILPGLNDSPAGLDALVKRAAEAGAKFIHGGPLFLMPSAMAQFMPFLQKEFPRLVRRYRKLYARSAYPPNQYKEEIAARIAVLRARYNLTSTRRENPPASGPAQLSLGL
ncbi:MAG TPA: radical SAM protein [Terriglobia bacterium]|nr:radical SAM protein [Terriglobia bacterium]